MSTKTTAFLKKATPYLLVVCILVVGAVAAGSRQSDMKQAMAGAALQERIEPAAGKVSSEQQQQEESKVLATSLSEPEAMPDYKLDVEQALMPRTLGDPNAPIKVEEFASLTCSHCATFHNETMSDLKEKYIDTGKVYFIFNDYPLNAPALKASMVARCLPPERYFGFISLLFKTQTQWSSGDYMNALRQNAKLAGLSNEAFDECVNNTALSEGIAAEMKNASEKWEINSTPSFVVNDGADIARGVQNIAAFDRVFKKLSAEPAVSKEKSTTE